MILQSYVAALSLFSCQYEMLHIETELGANATVPRLPIIATPGRFPAWDAYLDKVYTPAWRRVNGTTDLNAFQFFYWGSPLDDLGLKPRCVFRDSARQHEAYIKPVVVPHGNPRCRRLPEGLFQQLGFFVYRPTVRSFSAAAFGASPVEVMHASFEEEGIWFYLLRGTGIYLRPQERRQGGTRYYLHGALQAHYSVRVDGRPRLLGARLFGSGSTPSVELHVKGGSSRCSLLDLYRVDGSRCACDDAEDFLNCGAASARARVRRGRGMCAHARYRRGRDRFWADAANALPADFRPVKQLLG